MTRRLDADTLKVVGDSLGSLRGGHGMCIDHTLIAEAPIGRRMGGQFHR